MSTSPKPFLVFDPNVEELPPTRVRGTFLWRRSNLMRSEHCTALLSAVTRGNINMQRHEHSHTHTHTNSRPHKLTKTKQCLRVSSGPCQFFFPCVSHVDSIFRLTWREQTRSMDNLVCLPLNVILRARRVPMVDGDEKLTSATTIRLSKAIDRGSEVFARYVLRKENVEHAKTDRNVLEAVSTRSLYRSTMRVRPRPSFTS